VKILYISGTTRISESKIDNLETKSKIKNIRNFMGATVTLRRVASRELIVKYERDDIFTGSHSIWLGGGKLSRSY
jgi:hypothetical protein